MADESQNSGAEPTSGAQASYTKEERTFLHDVSNQLVVAQGMANFVFGKLKKEKEEGSKELERMGKAVRAVESIIELVKARREKLKRDAGEIS